MTAVACQAVLSNKRGLHARASAKFVEMADRFDAEVTVTKDGHSVTADSVMELLMLAASFGSTITIEAEGPDADEALAALQHLVEDRFGEDE